MFTTQRVLNELNILTTLNWRRHGIMLAIYAFFVAYIHYSIYQNDAEGKLGFIHVQVLTYFPLLFFAMLISIDVFKQLRDPIGGVQYMLTPSNTLEKFTASWLYACLFTFVAYRITYDVTHFICVSIINAFSDSHFVMIPQANDFPISFMNSTNMPFLFNNWSDFATIGLGFINIQALFFLGSAFFKKNPLIKTILVYVAYSIVVGLGAAVLIKTYGVETTRSTMQNTHQFQHVSGKMLPENIESTVKTIGTAFGYVFPLLAWYLTYQTLKRKQV